MYLRVGVTEASINFILLVLQEKLFSSKKQTTYTSANTYHLRASGAYVKRMGAEVGVAGASLKFSTGKSTL